MSLPTLLPGICAALLAVNVLAGESPAAPCPADPATGLVWEAKSDGDALRRKEWRYTGAASREAPDVCGSLAAPCDIERYLAALKRIDNGPGRPAGLCGRQDWRLPSRPELEALVDRHRLKPAADPDRVPGLEGDVYWTATPVAGAPELAWAVDMDRGLVIPVERKSYQRIVAVAGPAEAPPPCGEAGKTWRANADGTVTQPASGLVWKRCAAGQEWDGGRCQGQPSRLSWSGIEPPEGGWRLPSAAELSSLVAPGCAGPAIASDVFPDVPPGRFWTSTPAVAYPGFAWTVDFADGTVGVDVKHFGNHVRWVRYGENPAP